MKTTAQTATQKVLDILTLEFGNIINGEVNPLLPEYKDCLIVKAVFLGEENKIAYEPAGSFILLDVLALQAFKSVIEQNPSFSIHFKKVSECTLKDFQSFGTCYDMTALKLTFKSYQEISDELKAMAVTSLAFVSSKDVEDFDSVFKGAFLTKDPEVDEGIFFCSVAGLNGLVAFAFEDMYSRDVFAARISNIPESNLSVIIYNSDYFEHTFSYLISYKF